MGIVGKHESAMVEGERFCATTLHKLVKVSAMIKRPSSIRDRFCKIAIITVLIIMF